MASLNTVIEAIFTDSDRHSQIKSRYYGRNTNNDPTTGKKYIEIPIGSDVFELPLFAFEDFKEMHLNRKESDMIVASLYSCGQTSLYKSLDSIMKDVLSTHFSRHLCRVQIPNSANTYYATFGAVFDENFMPLMMLSWVMEKKANAEGVVKYHYKRPLLRLNPYPCLYKEDALQRFLAGKMITTTLNAYIHTPFFHECSSFIEQSTTYVSHFAKVEIDTCPFIVKGIDTPSVSVTNDGLLQLAADHIDEILQ